MISDFKFRSSGEAISEDMLISFEKEIGGTLDLGYRNFLLHRNGGVCSPQFSSERLEYPIMLFYPLRADGTGLLRGFENFNEHRSGDDVLPVAVTTGEQEICLRVGQTNSPVLISDEGSLVEVAASWDEFVVSLSQAQEEPRPALEPLAQDNWSEVSAFLEAGGNPVPDGEISLLSQTIRQDNFVLFDRLITEETGWGDLDYAVEVAVINNRLNFLKRLLEIGGSVEVARELAHGPERKEMRAYLQSLEHNASE